MKIKNTIPIGICSVIFGVLFIFNSISYSQLANWRYELPITISNTSSSQLINYQTLIVLNTRSLVAAGYMKPDGGDIRFAQNCGTGLIDYYLENYMNTDTTRIWIKISSLAPHSMMVVYLFMGNPAATSSGTLSLFEGPHSSTNYVSVNYTNTVPHSQRGFRFTANRDILVTNFGKRIPNQTARYVTLFDYNSHAIISQIQVSAGSPGNYNYNQLTRPVWLTAGSQYVLELFQGSGDRYYFGISSQVGPYLTYQDMRYCNNCTQNTFPTGSFPSLHYGTPDFLYYARQTPVNPEPSYSAGLAADTNTPAPPANLTAVGGNQQAFLTWRRNSEFDMNKYYVYVNTVNNPFMANILGTTNHPDTTFTATGLSYGTPYYFWIKAEDRFCSPRISDFSNVAVIAPLVVTNEEEIPREYMLYQNYPNPFNPVTEIKYDIPKESFVKLIVYDLLGREAAVLVSETKKPGKYNVKWNPENLPSGVYIYKMTAGEYSKTMKMVLVK